MHRIISKNALCRIDVGLLLICAKACYSLRIDKFVASTFFCGATSILQRLQKNGYMKHSIQKHLTGIGYLTEAYLCALKAFFYRHPFSFTKLLIWIGVITVIISAIIMTCLRVQSEREFQKSILEFNQRTFQLERDLRFQLRNHSQIEE